MKQSHSVTDLKENLSPMGVKLDSSFLSKFIYIQVFFFGCLSVCFSLSQGPTILASLDQETIGFEMNE